MGFLTRSKAREGDMRREYGWWGWWIVAGGEPIGGGWTAVKEDSRRFGRLGEEKRLEALLRHPPDKICVRMALCLQTRDDERWMKHSMG